MKEEMSVMKEESKGAFFSFPGDEEVFLILNF